MPMAEEPACCQESKGQDQHPSQRPSKSSPSRKTHLIAADQPQSSVNAPRETQPPTPVRYPARSEEGVMVS